MTTTSSHTYLTIISMGIVIYLTRIAGYWLAGRMKMNAVVETWLRYLPGCILISIVAPFALKADWQEAIGALIVIISMWRTKSLLLAMIFGIGFVAISRALL